MERPNLDDIKARGSAKFDKEKKSADALAAKAGQYKAAADKDFADASAGQQGVRQAELASQAFALADGIESPEMKAQAESLGMALAAQAESLVQPSDDEPVA